MKNRHALALAVGLVFLGTGFTGWGQEPKPAAADRWEPEIRKFEEHDQKSPPPAGANLFVGSSSIRMWKLETGFPKQTCINRGFGGSQLADAARYVERIVIPAKPRVVVLYSGDNDIASGKSPAAIRDDYKTFRDKIRTALPETRIVVISIKPSPSRWKLHEKAIEANRLLREETQLGRHEVFVDVWPAMLGDDGLPRKELFLKDELHMNETGYALWNKLIEPHLVSKTD
jgi:lysophospholipase L1-like esterase